MTATLFTCDESKLLSPYLDDELSPQRRREVEAHLRACADCAAELETLRKWSHLISSAPLPELSLELKDHLRQMPPARVSRPRLAWWLTAAAAVVFLIAVSQVLRQQWQSPHIGSTPSLNQPVIDSHPNPSISNDKRSSHSDTRSSQSAPATPADQPIPSGATQP